MITHSKPWIEDDERQKLNDVLESRMLAGGNMAQEFRQKLVELTGHKFLHLTPSGRYAVYSGLCSLKLNPGQKVMVQTYVCDAVIWAIRLSGLEPLFCDIGNKWVATPREVEVKMDGSVGAILLTPPFGLYQSCKPFRQFGVPVVQDLCQASPAILNRAEETDCGDAICFSFDATKYMCSGYGGALIFPSMNRADALLDSGVPFDELRAAVGLAQIGKLERIASRRKSIAEYYLEQIPHEVMLDTIENYADLKGNLFRFPLRVKHLSYEEISAAFEAEGIQIRRGVDVLGHRLLGIEDTVFANSVAALNETISLPYYPALSDEEVIQIATAARSILHL